MARRRNSSLFEDLFGIATMLPWWGGVLLAIGAYLLLHQFAIQPGATHVQPGDLGGTVVTSLFGTFAYFLQYLVPLALLLGAAASVIRKRRRAALVGAASAPNGRDPLLRMNWQEFEQLMLEAFLQKGFQARETSPGADGGIDIELRRDGELYLCQCKHWRAQKVGVSVVRELYGVMAAEGAAGGFVVTSGEFTEEARAFAQGRNVTLVDGDVLENWFRPLQRKPQTPVTAASEAAACPACGAGMVKRMAKRGANAGSQFWGCSRYPACRGTRPA